MTLALDERQVRRLVSDLEAWAIVLDVVAYRLATIQTEQIPAILEREDAMEIGGEGFKQLRRAIFGVKADAHMLVLSLRQINEHLRELRAVASLWTDEVTRAVDEFHRHYGTEALRDMRDMLEHSAEYVAGKGRKPNRIVDPGASWPGIGSVDGQISTLQLFGNDYQLTEVIGSALLAWKSVVAEHRRITQSSS